MEKWLVQAKKADFTALGNQFHIHPITARIIRNRDIITEEEFKTYLECDMNTLESPFCLKGMKEAVEILTDAIQTQKKIRVIGDYDIDGVCSGYVMTTGLEQFGAKVDFDVPDRIKDGYGLNVRLIDQAHMDDVELIVTCDNGIAAYDQIAYAKELGIPVIVTDHHEVPYTLLEDGRKEYRIPPAEAVIDHKQQDCPSTFKELCGAGVAYKVIMALYDTFECEKKWTEEKKTAFLKEMLVFTAIATVGDIVDLVGENRCLVKNGMKWMADVKNLGLQALITENGLDKHHISSYHIGFVIGPCINAGGRLETAKKAFDLFRCNNQEEATGKARELKEINDQRKNMTLEYTNQAIQMIEHSSYKDDKVLVVYLPGCHESIAGIIAGKIKENYYKPTFVLTDAAEGLKGSGRSVEGYHMFDSMVLADDIYRKEHNGTKGLFTKFGGHAMAAGLSLENQDFDEMRRILNQEIGVKEEALIQKIWIDVPLPFEYITERFIEELSILEPFGKANEKPVFAEKCTKIHRIRVFGKNRNVVSIRMQNKSGYMMEGTYFCNADEFLKDLTEKFGEDQVEAALNSRENSIKMNIIYYPEVNEYRGMKNIRVVIKRYS